MDYYQLGEVQSANLSLCLSVKGIISNPKRFCGISTPISGLGALRPSKPLSRLLALAPLHVRVGEGPYFELGVAGRGRGRGRGCLLNIQI